MCSSRGTMQDPLILHVHKRIHCLVLRLVTKDQMDHVQLRSQKPYSAVARFGVLALADAGMLLLLASHSEGALLTGEDPARERRALEAERRALPAALAGGAGGRRRRGRCNGGRRGGVAVGEPLCMFPLV